MKRILCLALTLALASSAQAWPFGPKGDSNAEKKANIRKQRDEMLAQLYAANPDMKKILKKAAGYATFKQVNVNLLLLATANGYGVVVDNKARKETFMRMGSLGGGVGAGVKDVRVIFVFHDAKVMKQFIEEGWQFGGQADAAAKYQDTGVSAEQNVKGNVSFHDGTVSAGSSTDVRGRHREERCHQRRPRHARRHGDLPVHRKRRRPPGNGFGHQVLAGFQVEPIEPLTVIETHDNIRTLTMKPILSYCSRPAARPLSCCSRLCASLQRQPDLPPSPTTPAPTSRCCAPTSTRAKSAPSTRS